MIQTGSKWPPDADRIMGYRDFDHLYEGEHHEVSTISQNLDRRLREMGADQLTYLVHDLPKLIVNIPVNLLLSKFPVISYPTERDEEGNEVQSEYGEALEAISKRSKLKSVILEHVQDASVFGDSVLVVSGGEGKARIECKPPYCYFPEPDPDDCKKIKTEALAWEREWDGKDVIRVDYYEEGYVYREAFWLEGTEVGQQLSEAELEEMTGQPIRQTTGVPDKNTLIHVANNPNSRKWNGKSDLGGGLITLFDELNERVSQLARILDKHSNPKMAGPKLHLGPDGSLRLKDYFETVDGTAPKYITWDAQLVAVFQHMDRLVDNIFALAEVAKALAYLVAGARYDSAPAAMMQFAQTLAKVARKLLYHDYALKEAVRIAVAMELGLTFEETPEPHIRWRHGLPKDPKAEAETEGLRIAAKTTSRKAAIMRSDDCDEATAEAQLAEIEDEEKRFGKAEPPPMPQQEEDPEEEDPADEPVFSLVGSEEDA